MNQGLFKKDRLSEFDPIPIRKNEKYKEIAFKVDEIKIYIQFNQAKEREYFALDKTSEENWCERVQTCLGMEFYKKEVQMLKSYVQRTKKNRFQPESLFDKNGVFVPIDVLQLLLVSVFSYIFFNSPAKVLCVSGHSENPRRIHESHFSTNK